jgi:DNA polymerase III epsilon subunit-like protein
MINFGEDVLRLQSELIAEEQCRPINGLSELALRKGKREELRRRLASIDREVRLLHQRLKRLPALPDLACIRWAQSILAYPNGRILIVDTVFSAEEAGIVHVLLLDFGGTVCFDRYIAPGGILSKQAMRDLGMTTQDLQEAPSLPQIWPLLLEALMGQYIVSYNLERVRRALEKEAEQYALDPLVIIGDCLLQRCQRYFQASGFVGLSSLCELVGHPLPDPPDCTAIDRARGQLHLLQSMAQGITGGHREVSTHEVLDNVREDELYL